MAAVTQIMTMAVGTRSIANLKAFQSRTEEE
jgi:hypothetical protein